MKSFDFYKSLYERELKRRHDLDSLINLPLTLITALVTVIGFITKNHQLHFCKLDFFTFMLCLTSTSIIISIYFLTASFNNLFVGYGYRNFAYTEKLRQYELEIDKFNNTVSDDKKINYENKLIERMNKITDYNIILNDKRSRFLYYAKTTIIISLFLTGILFFIKSIYF